METFLEPAIIISFLTLAALEIVLGVDNLILISILTDKLPKEQQPLARKIGIMGAVVTRLMLLTLIFMMAQLTTPLFMLFDLEFSWREILLIVGGLFLLMKATLEIHHKIEGAGEGHGPGKHYAAFGLVVAQIMVMDVVFSFDTVLTAVGIADHLEVMVAAILVSVVFMLLAMEAVNSFIVKHPTVKVLALSYMMLIGMALIGEGFHQEIPKGYLYFAMAFSFGVELINMIIRSRAARVAAQHRAGH
jgi:predicted tellurium resistance membrane protein TerC